MHACVFLCVSAGEYACDGVRVCGIRRRGAPRGLMLGTPSTLFMAGRELESGPTSAMDRSESEGALVLVLGWAARLTGGDDEGPVGRGFTCTLTNRMEPRASPTHGVDARTEIRARTPHSNPRFLDSQRKLKTGKVCFWWICSMLRFKKNAVPVLSIFTLPFGSGLGEGGEHFPAAPLYLSGFLCSLVSLSSCTRASDHRPPTVRRWPFTAPRSSETA